MEREFPEHWVPRALFELTQSRGTSINPAKYPAEVFELYSVPSYETGVPERVSGMEIGSSKQVVESDSVLLCKINPRINRAWVVGSHTDHRQIASTEWIVFPPSEDVDPRFLCFFLKQNAIRDFLAQNVSGVGGSLMRVKPSTLKGYPFPIAPLNEQRRIVEKIETLFARLDQGEAALRKVQVLLVRYRQSVLKAAVTGQLTADWRRQRGNRNWKETTLGALAEYLTSGSRGWAEFYSDSGDIFIRAQNLKHDRLDLADVAYVALPSKSEGIRTRVSKGDLLITITGANVTKSALVEQELGTAYVSQHVALFRPTDEVDPEFLYWFVIAEAGGRKQLETYAYGAGKPGLNLQNIREVRLSLPPLEEQREIVQRIRTALSQQEAVLDEVARQLQGSSALRQSILKDAFSGRLVPQDLNDEPAAELLARIRANREGGPKKDTRKKVKA